MKIFRLRKTRSAAAGEKASEKRRKCNRPPLTSTADKNAFATRCKKVAADGSR
jgi:hypothetical protein